MKVGREDLFQAEEAILQENEPEPYLGEFQLTFAEAIADPAAIICPICLKRMRQIKEVHTWNKHGLTLFEFKEKWRVNRTARLICDQLKKAKSKLGKELVQKGILRPGRIRENLADKKEKKGYKVREQGLAHMRMRKPRKSKPRRKKADMVKVIKFIRDNPGYGRFSKAARTYGISPTTVMRYMRLIKQ